MSITNAMISVLGVVYAVNVVDLILEKNGALFLNGGFETCLDGNYPIQARM